MSFYLSHGCIICSIKNYIECEDSSNVFDCVTEVIGYVETLPENDLCRFFQPIGSEFLNISEILEPYEI